MDHSGLQSSIKDLSLRNSERLVQANINAFIGSVGNFYDNALAESINE
ncbi:hypothetical protein R2083_14415 [Nitrosomonas sp. Is35]|nr:hypothetical protein [Nitrosomonas sp. Is35]MDV6348711.1 hypothetical protein [Nitrosomonas sp. Is35]